MNRSQKSKICIISDVHGKHKEYLDIVNKVPFSLQLGDLAFNYWFLKDVDPNKHVYFKGNHDNFDVTSSHDLGKYGLKTLNGVEFFYIRGAFSIDYKFRQKYERETGLKIWWEQEELDESDLENAYNLYCDIKPKIMITHEVPRSISNNIGNPSILREFGFNPATFTSRTSEWLEKCWQYHKPTLYIAGHYHIKKDILYDKSRFICLPELGTVEIDNKANVFYKTVKKK